MQKGPKLGSISIGHVQQLVKSHLRSRQIPFRWRITFKYLLFFCAFAQRSTFFLRPHQPPRLTPTLSPTHPPIRPSMYLAPTRILIFLLVECKNIICLLLHGLIDQPHFEEPCHPRGWRDPQGVGPPKNGPFLKVSPGISGTLCWNPPKPWPAPPGHRPTHPPPLRGVPSLNEALYMQAHTHTHTLKCVKPHFGYFKQTKQEEIEYPRI